MKRRTFLTGMTGLSLLNINKLIACPGFDRFYPMQIVLSDNIDFNNTPIDSYLNKQLGLRDWKWISEPVTVVDFRDRYVRIKLTPMYKSMRCTGLQIFSEQSIRWETPPARRYPGNPVFRQKVAACKFSSQQEVTDFRFPAMITTPFRFICATEFTATNSHEQLVLVSKTGDMHVYCSANYHTLVEDYETAVSNCEKIRNHPEKWREPKKAIPEMVKSCMESIRK